MVVLRAIGRFFKKIWDWIRQTAWIQPLLIVGVIFGVIFSIPSIVKAVKNNRKEKSTYAAYYHNFKLSLEGGENSEADKFSRDLYDVMYSGKVDEFRSAHSDLGDKFFVAYVAKDCDKCESAKEGFKQFQDKFSKYVDEGETNKFHLVTIFTDDETSETTETESAFVQYLRRNDELFAEISSSIQESDYYKNGHISEEDLQAFETADEDDFLTPSIFLVELGKDATDRGFNPGATELMFGVDGSDKSSKALTLSDCWRHAGDFSNNPEK